MNFAPCACVAGSRDPHVRTKYTPVGDPSISSPIIEIPLGRPPLFVIPAKAGI